MVEYIWIDGTGEHLRSKTKTVETAVNSISDLSDWNFDGSSTGQATNSQSEVILKPRALFKDPFNANPDAKEGFHNTLVMCDCWTPDNEPVESNTRYRCDQAMSRHAHQKPWFGIEQEYLMYTLDKHPLGWPVGGFPGPQGPYYCGVGADRVFGRELVVSHYNACLYAGVKVSGINAEVMPGQWEFQVGPCEGTSIGDHMWMGRFLLARMGEMMRVVISYDPKPVSGDWNGGGAHCNFSTEKMRNAGGYDEIVRAVKRLEKNHDEHMLSYGSGNERRMTGLHETADYDKFTWGVAHRGASVRIASSVQQAGCGYFEDRRPASNADPYVVAGMMVESCLDE
eukprot:TRINITY_DN4128_c0_g1_i1.p1 TRINITY_DN4128_c0_g1~~TRINITY_DN4128_c0_g1_i1.p1  ORF type:complete len:340 (-),score=59.43 TRINITY_DN4128_c0_g1_i1:87-1106(-)